MTANQIWALICLVISIGLIIIGVIFALLKEKGAILISGFDFIPKEEKTKYDIKKMSKDMRNALMIWAGVLMIGCISSYLISYYFAVVALAVWLVLVFKDVKFDEKKAFEKYKL